MQHTDTTDAIMHQEVLLLRAQLPDAIRNGHGDVPLPRDGQRLPHHFPRVALLVEEQDGGGRLPARAPARRHEAVAQRERGQPVGLPGGHVGA